MVERWAGSSWRAAPDVAVADLGGGRFALTGRTASDRYQVRAKTPGAQPSEPVPFRWGTTNLSIRLPHDP